MTYILPLEKIAVNNNNAAGFTLVTDLVDSNGVKFVKVRGKPFRTRGIRRVRLDETTAFIGATTLQWVSSVMLVEQYDLLVATYEGLVTISHPLSGGTFASYNAILTMPDEIDLEYIPNLSRAGLISGFTGAGYQEVVWSFRKVEAL